MPIAFDMIVIGTSLGGLSALRAVLHTLPANFPTPILIVRHLPANTDDYVIETLSRDCLLTVQKATQGQAPQPGCVYIAPPDRHLQLDPAGCLQITDTEKVNFSRPAIDPLFFSAAQQYGRRLIAVLLTGANADGAQGLLAVKQAGGTVIIQDPKSAEADVMPLAGLALLQPDHLVWLSQIGSLLWDLTRDTAHQ